MQVDRCGLRSRGSSIRNAQSSEDRQRIVLWRITGMRLLWVGGGEVEVVVVVWCLDVVKFRAPGTP